MKLIMEERVLDWPNARMSEEEFFAFCMANPEQPMERDEDGNILIMAPIHFESARYESAAITALGNWNNQYDKGYVLSSSAGFTLPNGAVRSPDAAWVSYDRMDSLPKSEHRKFAHICPDFVIEIRSESDNLITLGKKMQEYMENGAQLGFLIDPYNHKAYVYRGDRTVDTVEDFTQSLSGEGVLPGFELPLSLFTSK